MKNFKLFGLALVSVLCLGFYACNSGAKTEVKDVVEETTVVEETVVADTVAVADTLQAEEPEVMEAE